MQNSRIAFARTESQCGLRFGGADVTAAPDVSRPQRQHRSYIILRAMKLLPVCTPVSAAVVYLLSRLIPVFDLITAAWSVGLIALTAAAVCAAVSWACSRRELTDSRLTLHTGVLLRQETVIDVDRVLSVEVVHTPFTALMNACRLTVRTAGRVGRSTDTLLLSDTDAAALSARLVPSAPGRTRCFAAGKGSLWLEALSGEGLAAFYSAAAPIFTALQDVSGRFLENGIAQLAHRRGMLIAAAAVFGGAWLLKVLHTRITRAGMTAARIGDTLLLRRGFISRRNERLRIGSVCALETRFSLPGAFFRRYACSVMTPCGSAYPLLPPSDRRRLNIETAAISPHGSRRCSVRPQHTVLSYAAGRWAQCLLLLPLSSFLRRLMPHWSTTASVVTAIAAIVLLWRAAVTSASAPCAGLDLFTDCAELTGIHRLSIRRIRVFRPELGMIRITQNPIARLFGHCTVCIIPKGFRRNSVPKCIRLPFERTMAVCERLM